MLAGFSVEYYERLEQSRSAHPSPAMLGALERALRLSAAEGDYLYRLAGHPAPVRKGGDGRPHLSVEFLLDSLTTVAAHVMDNRTTVLAQNRLSIAILGRYAGSPSRESNMAWRWFTDPAAREMYLPSDHEEIGNTLAAELHDAAVRHGVHDHVAVQLCADLRQESDEFAMYWARMQVAPFRTARRVLLHPVAGQLSPNCEIVAETLDGHRVLILRPEPGTETVRLLSQL